METDSKPLKVDWDPKYNRFLIRCPMWANDLVRQLPNRRWAKGPRAWGAAPVRQNIDVLTGDLAEYVEFTHEAQLQVKRSDEVQESKVKTGFPSWYQFKTDPDPHQIEALNYLYPLNAIALHMDRGTGKTKTTIDYACALRMEGKIDALVVLCKLSLRENWVDEFNTHAPISVLTHLPETTAVKAYEEWLRYRHDFKCLIVGFESLSQGGMHKIVEKFLLAHSKVMIIGDETHMISNHKAVRSERVVSYGRMAEYRAGLTGTPISTGPLNLYMQYEFLDPSIIGIGDFYAFRNRYAVMGGYEDDKGRPLQVVGYQNIDELTRLVAPYTFQVDKSVLKLPPKTFERRHVAMTKEQRQLYDEVRKKKGYEIEGRVRETKNALELALRLHQIAQGHITVYKEKEVLEDGLMVLKERGESKLLMPWDKNPKILEVSDILSETEKVPPTTIWCNYKADIENLENMMRHKFPHVKWRTVSGKNDETVNFKNIEDFQKGKVDVLLSNTGVGGTGHNMFRAELVIYLNNNERLIDRLQSEDRAHRRGLDHPVLYIDVLASKSVDETIMHSIEDKQNLSDYIRKRIGDLVSVLAGTK